MVDFCDEIEKLGKGIGNANRYRILEALSRGPKTVSEIVLALKLSQPAISQHLKTLKGSGLVADKRQGQEVYYAINLSNTLNLLRGFISHIDRARKKSYEIRSTSFSRKR